MHYENQQAYNIHTLQFALFGISFPRQLACYTGYENKVTLPLDTKSATDYIKVVT